MPLNKSKTSEHKSNAKKHASLQQTVDNTSTQKQLRFDPNNLPVHGRLWFIILTTILFIPGGLFLLYRFRDYYPNWKPCFYTIAIIALICYFGVLCYAVGMKKAGLG